MQTTHPYFTLHEAAERLRLKPRTVAKIARRYGLCSIFGRNIILSADDIKDIWEIQRVAAQSPRPTPAPTLSAFQLERMLAKLTGKKTRKR